MVSTSTVTLRVVRKNARAQALALQIAVIVVVAVAWEAVSRFGVLNSTEFPPFTVVIQALFATLADPGTWVAMGWTVLGWFIGLALACIVGVTLGLLIGQSRFLTRSTSLLIDILRSTPAAAIIFVLILVLGTTLTMKVALVFFAAVWPILIQSLYGVRAVDPVLRDLQRSYRISPMVGFFRIRLPAASPYIATGIRISSSLALIVAVVAEYLGGVEGVGQLVDRVRQVGDFPRMYALILLVGFLSIALNWLTLTLERYALRWHPSHRKDS